MVNVVCMKWGNKYDAKYVNILRSMVERNLDIDHRFVCFTEHSEGIREDVEIFPLPELSLPNGIHERCWRKLSLFEDRLADLEGTTLFLDLDVVIVGRLEPFFDVEGEFFISHDWKWYGPQKITGNSSCIRFEIGKHQDIIDDFKANQETVRKTIRNEQEFLSLKMHEKGCLNYWPDNWCCSFKAHCMPKIPFRYFQEPTYPDGTRVVIFHGDPNPPEAAQPGFISPRKCWKASTWINDFWYEAA